MEQTFNLLAEKDRKELLGSGVVKELESGVKYLIINENDDDQ